MLRCSNFRSSIALFTAIVLTPIAAGATTVKAYEAIPPSGRSKFVVSFLEKMTYDIGQKDPELARRIKEYFVRTPPGKSYSEGLEDISVELAYLDSMAKQGKVDLSRVQIEGVIVTVMSRRFSQVRD